MEIKNIYIFIYVAFLEYEHFLINKENKKIRPNLHHHLRWQIADDFLRSELNENEWALVLGMGK